MAKELDAKCKLCRRSGEKLFLKGDRCISQKCAMVRRPYAPGVHGKAGSKGLSEYGRQLAMKQKIKRIYGVFERQFRKHFEDIKGKKQGIIGDLLIQRLEFRLDNVVYRMGFAASRSLARQLVSHGMFSVNGKKVSVGACEVRVGDVIQVRPEKLENAYFKNIRENIKLKKDFPVWVKVETGLLRGVVTAKPNRGDIDANINPQMVVEFYSK